MCFPPIIAKAQGHGAALILAEEFDAAGAHILRPLIVNPFVFWEVA